MNKTLRMNVPCFREGEKPRVPDRKLLVEWEEEQRWKPKVKFDRCYRAWNLLPALTVDLVWIPDRREQGTVGDEVAPWSYEVETPSSTFKEKQERYNSSPR